MRSIARRDFLRQSAAWGLAAGATIWPAAGRRAEAASANDKIVLAVVGVRGRGYSLAEGFAARPDCDVAYLADVDLDVAGARVGAIASLQGHVPRVVQDFRYALDDRAVDAIVVATPDHWHALATIWGCQAGKHVYVEKPASHTPWEGRKMVEAARKHKRVVQVGLQNRSATCNQSAKQYIASRRLGRVYLCRVYNQKSWPSLPRLADSAAPAALNWKMWTGPAPLVRYNSSLHNAWNHFWQYSGGDIIHEGVHQLDLARWLIGKDYPRSVSCTGESRQDAGSHETPDTQVAVYDFGDVRMTYDLTTYTPYGIENGPGGDGQVGWPQSGARVEIYGTKGVLVARGEGDGWRCYDHQRTGKPALLAEDNGVLPDAQHLDNFCESIRASRRPNADIEEGHRSTLLCQYANIGYRLGGKKLSIDARTETTDDPQANAMLKREYRSGWAVPEQV